MQKLFGSIPSTALTTDQLSGAANSSDSKCIWLHAVSVGEVILLQPIVRELRKSNPDQKIAISTSTETGYDVANERFSGDYVFFCPMDFTWAIKRVLKRLNPSMFVLAELELWPNLIKTVAENGIPVAVVNGRLGHKSFRGYQRFGFLIRPIMKRVSLVCAQSEAYAKRFRQLGCEQVIVTGSVKFDGVETNRENANTVALRELASIQPNHKTIVAGSTQLEEDLLVAKSYQQLCQKQNDIRLILAPRHPERVSTLVAKLSEMGLPTIRRSGLGPNLHFDAHCFRDSNKTSPREFEPNPILIIDVIGELGFWWGCADAAYVGGSMGSRGGQNMIEPSAFGIPVSFGPATWNFREVVEELMASDAATVIRSHEDMTSFFTKSLNDQLWSEAIGSRAKAVVLKHAGASKQTADLLLRLQATIGKTATVSSTIRSGNAA